MEVIVASWFVAVGESDRRTGLLRTVVLWPGIMAVVAGAVPAPMVLVSALAAALPYLLAHGLGHTGGGDVKLAFLVGGMLGDPMSALAGVGLAQTVSLVGFLGDRRRRRPHGPSLAGVTAVMVVGP